MDPSEINFFSSEIEFVLTTDGETISNTTEIELGKRVEVEFVSLSNMDSFYIENCTAMDDKSAELSLDSLPLIELGLDTFEKIIQFTSC